MMPSCPACLPPDNQGCATCGGTSTVAEEVRAQFLAAQKSREDAIALVQRICDAMAGAEDAAQVRDSVQAILDGLPK